MSLKRAAVGFALAPLPVVVPLTFLFGFILLDRPDDGESVLEALLQGILASYGAVLTIGLPIHFALRKLGRYSLIAYLGRHRSQCCSYCRRRCNLCGNDARFGEEPAWDIERRRIDRRADFRGSWLGVRLGLLVCLGPAATFIEVRDQARN